jgi:hypothetical protein
MALSKISNDMFTTISRPNSIPLILNSDMAVAQRGASATALTNGSDGYHTLDRWRFDENGAPSYEFTMTQESLTSGNAYTDGFANAMKFDCTTAQGSLASADYIRVEQRLEGQDLQLIKKGTANAEKLTVAFWVKATKTGTNICTLVDADNNRHCSQSYTISTTNTWEHKVVNFPADTTGALGDDNGRSLDVIWYIAAGANFTGGTLATSWASFSATNEAVGQVNNADSTSNNFHLTGVQLEIGEFNSSTLPPFQHESYDVNLKRCERYYQVVGSGTRADNLTYFSAYNHDGTSTMFGIFNFRTTMRTGPSIDQTSGTDYYTFKCNNATDDFDGVNGFRGGIHAGEFYLSGGSSVGSSSAGEAGKVMGKDASSHIALAAEL